MFTIGLLILLCKDNVLVLIDSYMGGQSAVWAGRPEHLKIRSVKLWWNGGRGIFPFPDIFLLVDCFKWALIGDIGQWRVDSVLWQFQMGEGGIIGRGDNRQFIYTGISLYIPISWLFQMGSHWQHWTAQSWLSALAVSNGGRADYREGDNCQFICTCISWYIPISWPFQMGSHWWHWTVQSWLSALAVSNGGRGDHRKGG